MSGGEVGFRGGSQFTWTVSDGKLFVPTSTSLQRGSTLTVSGGTVVSKPFSPTSTSRWTLRINRGDLALTGGTVDARLEIDAGTVTWSGSDLLAGREDVAFEGGLLSIVGSDFTLDGQAVTNFDTLGERTVTERGQTLAGILADGTAFAFELLAPSQPAAAELSTGLDTAVGEPLSVVLASGDAMVQLVLVPEPAAAGVLIVTLLLTRRDRRRSLTPQHR